MTRNEQARADAMADAETYFTVLRTVHRGSRYYDLPGVWAAYLGDRARQWATIYNTHSDPSQALSHATILSAQAAHKAFCAVPGLRGE